MLCIFLCIGIFVSTSIKTKKINEKDALDFRKKVGYIPRLCPVEKKPEEPKPTPAPKPEPKPETKKTLKSWVEQNVDYLFSFLEDETVSNWFIPADILQDIDRTQLCEWLMGQFRVECVQMQDTGIKVSLANPLI
jgi:hypothetical protein